MTLSKGVKWRTGIKRSQLESPGIDMLYKMVSDPTAWKHEQTSRNFSKKRIIDGHFHLRFNIFFQRVFGIDELFPWILSKMQVLTLYQVIENPPEKMSAKMFDTLNFCFYKSWGIFPRGWVIWIIQLSTKKGIWLMSYMSKHVIMSWFLWVWEPVALPSSHGEESSGMVGRRAFYGPTNFR